MEGRGPSLLALRANDNDERRQSIGHATVAVKKSKAAPSKVGRVPATCPLSPQISPPNAMAPWETININALPRPRTESGIAR